MPTKPPWPTLRPLLLLLALLLAPLKAQAQTQAVPRPPCYPTVNGYPASLPRLAVGDVGVHVYWACSTSKGAAPIWWGFSCIKDDCSGTLLREAVARFTRASAKVGAANSEWSKAVTYSCTAVLNEQTQRGQLCRERLTLLHKYAAGWLL